MTQGRMTPSFIQPTISIQFDVYPWPAGRILALRTVKETPTPP